MNVWKKKIEEEIVILDEAPTIFKTRKPKRTHKVREQLEDSFLRQLYPSTLPVLEYSPRHW